MGNCVPSKAVTTQLTKDNIDFLIDNTSLDKTKIKELHESFLKSWPDGKLSIESFKDIMKHLSKNGDASKFIDHVFRAFDEDRNGYIDITEYIMGSYLASEKSTLDEKLSFAFKLYDIDGDNMIEAKEIEQIIEALYDLRGVEIGTLSEDKLPSNIANELINRFDKNGDSYISEEEFLKGCKDNSHIARVILTLFS